MLFKYFSMYTPSSTHTSKPLTSSTMTPSSSTMTPSSSTMTPSSSTMTPSSSTMTQSSSESQTSSSYLPSSPKTPTSKKHKLDGRIQPMKLAAPKDLKTFHAPLRVRRNLLDSFEKAVAV